MNRLASGVWWATLWLLIAGPPAIGQTPGMGMHMAKSTLLLAQLDAKQVAVESSSKGTGTGAFLLDSHERTLTYRLTYEGLAAGGAKRIALYNFGRGRNGAFVGNLCDPAARPCPAGSGATLDGRLERGEGRTLDNHLIGEFDSGRIYIEIQGASGKPEIRGQLGQNSAMVPFTNYVVDLAPVEGTRSKGTGTAVLSETHLPGGKISLFYAATVTGTSGPPINVALADKSVAMPRPFNPQMALRGLDLRESRDQTQGGSLSGHYEVSAETPDALYPQRLLSAGGPVGLVVATSRHPDGELYGALMPVQ